MRLPELKPPRHESFARGALLLACALLVVFSFACPVRAAEAPGKGDTLPPLQLLAPSLTKDQHYLGVPPHGVFGLEQISGDLVLLELVGVYCPYCHKQAPWFNSLFTRLQRGGLDERVKMLAVASGATEPEVAQLRKHSNYAYPVLRDEDYSVHKALGEPKTPYTLVVNKKGEILFAKLGVIVDIDGFFNTIKKLLP